MLKVFGRGFGGDSPQCGEMSEGQRGPPLLAEPFLRKVSPDNMYKYSKKYRCYNGSIIILRPVRRKV